MQARILTKITYPTGGFTDFEYEAHRYDGGQMAGGLRIKALFQMMEMVRSAFRKPSQKPINMA
jgi:hypothetical protein